MVKRRKALGRGLEALLGEKSKKYNSNVFNEIDINKIIRNNNQPRSNFNKKQLNELAISISTHGIIQPITVRKIDGNTYQLISGERRFRASKISNLKSIPAFIKNAKDDEMLEMALIENIQRENLNSLEIAISYKKLIDELKINQEHLAKRVGKDRSTINNYLRLLKLPPTIQKGIMENKIQMGHARSLITIETSEMQLEVYKKMLENKLSVRNVENLVRKLGKTKNYRKKISTKNKDIEKLEAKLSSFLGTKIKISGNSIKGEIIVPYKNTNDLNRILELLDII
jgi:ParB family chromosome partitioning protein